MNRQKYKHHNTVQLITDEIVMEILMDILARITAATQAAKDLEATNASLVAQVSNLQAQLAQAQADGANKVDASAVTPLLDVLVPAAPTT